MITNGSERPRWQLAKVSVLGTSQLHLRNPFVIAWWSAAMPGFGHLLLSKYITGYVLLLWEMVINTQIHLNLAMVYSFTGQFDMVQDTLDLRWLPLYAPFYLFAIYDSYRITINFNKAYVLASREKVTFNLFHMNPIEVHYLMKCKPWLAIAWSMLIPGMGQLYIHRIFTALYILLAWILFCYQSHAFEVVHLTLLGNFTRATAVANIEWFLFIPSIYLFSIYDAYTNTVENNKLFAREQVEFLQHNYQQPQARAMLTKMGANKS